jgi:hypothetical protein
MFANSGIVRSDLYPAGVVERVSDAATRLRFVEVETTHET